MLVIGRKSRLTEVLKDVWADIEERLTRDLHGIKSVTDLSDRVRELRQSVEALEIEKGRKQEEFDRRERELEHKIGLERERQKTELAAGKREATLAVREENLAADQKRFAEQMAFHEKRFTEEVGYLKDMVKNVLDRLPDVTANLEIGGKRGRPVR